MGIYIVKNTSGNTSVLQGRPQIGNIELDASISENHSFSSSAPQYAVEDGSVISDNIINDPVRLTMRATVAVTGGDPYRADQAFQELLNIRDNKQPITVITSAKVYDNMVLVSLDVVRTKSAGQALLFDAEFQEVVFADVEVVTVEKISKQPKKSAPKKKEAEQPTEEPPPSMQDLMRELEDSYYVPEASTTGVF